MAEYNKPLPWVNVDTQPFWDGCKQHVLVIQRCEQCQSYRFPPSTICPKCYAMNTKWEKVSGKGEVYTFTVARNGMGSWWEPDMPFTIGVIQLDEGVRMLSNVVGCKPEDVNIGMKVEVVFDDITEEFTLAKFKPAA